MAAPETPFFISCGMCGWKTYQRTLGCEPTVKQLEKRKKMGFEGRECPKCGSEDLNIKPANNLKGIIAGWLWESS